MWVLCCTVAGVSCICFDCKKTKEKNSFFFFSLSLSLSLSLSSVSFIIDIVGCFFWGGGLGGGGIFLNAYIYIYKLFGVLSHVVYVMYSHTSDADG